MFTFSDYLISSVMDAGWDTAFTSPVIEIRAGARPAQPEDASAGDLLCTVTLPVSGYFAGASGGVKDKAGTWTGVVSAGGTPTWFRLCNAADSGGVSAILPRLDGDIGATGSGADLILGDGSIIAGDTINIDSFPLNWSNMFMLATGTAAVIHEAAMAMTSSGTMTASGTVV